MSLEGFLIEWFRGFAGGSLVLREVGWCHGAVKRCTFYREALPLEGFLSWLNQHLDLSSMNLFMGIGFWLDPGRLEPEQSAMLYDRISYDFDSDDDPNKAVEAALTFAENIEAVYGVAPIVFLSGFKGAHVVIPLEKPTDWDGYHLLWNHLLKLVPKDYRQLVDRNMLQWNRLDRVPLTWNIKDVDGVVRKAFAKIVYPEEFTWGTFRWSKLKALNPSDVKVYKVVLPEVKLVSKPTASIKEYKWVERVVESGLPDGRHRFILYVLSAYLVNVKQLSIEEAYQVIKKFIENSCKSFNNCSKVCDSFILGDLRRVKQKKLKPTSLKTLQQKDPELFNIITKVLGSNLTNTNSSVEKQFEVPQELVDFVKETAGSFECLSCFRNLTDLLPALKGRGFLLVRGGGNRMCPTFSLSSQQCYQGSNNVAELRSSP